MQENRFGDTVRWLFEDRATGKIVVAQVPNLAAWLFLAAAGLSFATTRGTWPATLLRGIEGASLAFWSLDELFRGVNPWRRFLGLIGLFGVVVVFWQR